MLRLSDEKQPHFVEILRGIHRRRDPRSENLLCVRFSKRAGSRLPLQPPRSAVTSFAIGCDNSRYLASSAALPCRPATFGRFCSGPTELCASDCRLHSPRFWSMNRMKNRLMVRAGVGWASGTIDAVSLAADIGSPAGYALPRPERPSYRTTWRRIPASARLSCWRIIRHQARHQRADRKGRRGQGLLRRARS